MAAELDLDGSAQIGYDEFEGMIFRMYKTKPNRSNQRKQCSIALHRYLGPELSQAELRTQCRDIFKQFDADGSGRIDMGELLDALRAFGVEDLAEQDLLGIVDELGIDQGSGEESGLDFPSFGRLVGALYANEDNEESVWERARLGLTRLAGAGLGDVELLERTDAVFRDLDADASGLLDLEELQGAMRLLGVEVQDDELSRMVEESDTGGRLWVVRVTNRWGHAECFLKITVLEGAADLHYASVDVFCRVGDKLPPLKVARIRGAAPFHFISVSPPLPEGLALDPTTGTVSGRPLEERPKAEYTVIATNAVGSTSGSFFLQTLVEPSGMSFEYAHCIYKEGRLKFPAWDMARDGMLRQLGPSLTTETLEDLTRALFESMDADHSGLVSVEELKGAFEVWQVQVSDEDLVKMITECAKEATKSEAVPAYESNDGAETAEDASVQMKELSAHTQNTTVELGFEAFHDIIQQAYYGFKSGADRFKTDPCGGWIANENHVNSILGTPPFIFTITPDLPQGLRIDRESGSIRGVPHHVCRSTTYSVRARNRVGETTCELTIEVLEPPSDLHYATHDYLLPANQPIRPMKCAVNGTRDAECGKMTFRAGRDPEQVIEKPPFQQSKWINVTEF